MQLLISDANILIDLEEGQVIEEIFSLPYEFTTPDALFYEELEELHGDLLKYGLTLKSLTPESIDYLETITGIYLEPSRPDCMALALAQQEKCPLLTGDQNLKKSAKLEKVEVRGTLWLIEQLVCENIITLEKAHRAYELMEENGRWLPFSLAHKNLDKLNR